MFRPPAVPLVTHSPYFSIWSMSDTLNGDWPRHWTGSPHGMCGFVRFGDRVYRWLGNATHLGEHMLQVSLEVTATASIYRFTADGNEMTVTFRSPVLVEDLDLVSRPVTYLSVETNRPATVYVDLAAEVAVDKPNQEVTGGSFRLGDLRGAFVRKAVPEPLRRSGDDLRIEWGTAYLAGQGQSAIVLSDEARGEFVKTGKLPDSDCLDFPRRAEDAWPAAAAISEGTRHEFLLAYDEEFAYEFFGRRLRPLGGNSIPTPRACSKPRGPSVLKSPVGRSHAMRKSLKPRKRRAVTHTRISLRWLTVRRWRRTDLPAT